MLYLKTKYPQMYLKTRTIMSRKVNWNLFATSHSTSKTFGILHQATDSLIHSITQNHEQQMPQKDFFLLLYRVCLLLSTASCFQVKGTFLQALESTL